MRLIAEDWRVLLFVYSLALLQGFTIMLMLSRRRNVPRGMAQQGQLQTAFYFGTLLVGVLGGILFELLFGTKRTASTATLLVSGGAFVMGLAPSHTMLIAGDALFGMGNGPVGVGARPEPRRG